MPLAKPSTLSTAESVPALERADWGTLGYREAHERQLAVLAERQEERCPDTLVFVEHPHVITVGRRREAVGNILAAGSVDVVEVERGGDVTYHGPGQLVAYPIVLLREGERDLHAYLRNLEEAMLRTCVHFGLDDCGREEGKTGVWRGGRKLASIGIACRRWVTFHGVALNVSTDLSYFQRINPCGFQASVMTSMQQELERPLTVGEVKEQLAAELAVALGRELVGSPTG